MTFRHSIGNEIKILDRIFNFNIGPFESGGSSTTINNGEYSFSEPFLQTAGASFRRIVDFSNLDSSFNKNSIKNYLKRKILFQAQ